MIIPRWNMSYQDFAVIEDLSSFEMCTQHWLVVVYRRFGTNLYAPSSRVKQSSYSWTAWSSNMGPIGCPETSVTSQNSYYLTYPYFQVPKKRAQEHIYFLLSPSASSLLLFLSSNLAKAWAYLSACSKLTLAIFVISGFSRGINEIFVLLRCYAAFFGSWITN
jgi:hypothetical protein